MQSRYSCRCDCHPVAIAGSGERCTCCNKYPEQHSPVGYCRASVRQFGWFVHRQETRMSPDNIDTLTTRVQFGFLVHATEEQMREQLNSEGISPNLIDAAIKRGARAANVRLSNE